MGRRAPPFKQPSGAQYKRSGANGCYVARVLRLTPDKVDRFTIGHRLQDARPARHANQVELRTIGQNHEPDVIAGHEVSPCGDAAIPAVNAAAYARTIKL